MKLLPASLHVFQLGARAFPLPRVVTTALVRGQARRFRQNLQKVYGTTAVFFPHSGADKRQTAETEEQAAMDYLHYTKEKTIRLASFITTSSHPSPVG